MLRRRKSVGRRPRKAAVTRPADMPGLAREFDMFESQTDEGRFVGWSRDVGSEARDLFLFMVQLPGWTWDGTGGAPGRDAAVSVAVVDERSQR